MAKNTIKTDKNRIKIPESKSIYSGFSKESKPKILEDDNIPIEKLTKLIGLFLIITSVFLYIAMLSHLFSWIADYDVLHITSLSNLISPTGPPIKNICKGLGAVSAYILINQGFGISAFFIPSALLLLALNILKIKDYFLLKIYFKYGFIMLWASVLFGTLFQNAYSGIMCGAVGFELCNYLKGIGGYPFLLLILLFSAAGYILFTSNLNKLMLDIKKKTDYLSKLQSKHKGKNTLTSSEFDSEDEIIAREEENLIDKLENEQAKTEKPEELDELASLSNFSLMSRLNAVEIEAPQTKTKPEQDLEETKAAKTDKEDIGDNLDLEIINTVEQRAQQEAIDAQLAKKEKNHYGIETPFDPSLELSGYIHPSTDLLMEFKGPIVDEVELKAELIANKNRIVDVLQNYSIEISNIKATVGPTVTLYEIIPAAGVRISKIKNLEDDIALALAALGIRIIAPIPGKGTIGIEVPNRTKQIVSMRTMMESDMFKNTDMDLPIAFGKTISNEPYIADLSKMPHLLMAGATGQGKSVGINAIIASILYKKHPSEVKFVMVDPKKVELSLFNKIERHFLAKLPDSEEAIITDVRKVVRTLNSLCIEMDQRYDLLKDAQVRNIKEYNAKFISRRLNPNEGHRFLPYIVLIIDEFADLIMTAGKEIELPIARLAQLARAIGIHLVVATQRPSVNVITGIIKANFPARAAFRVSSKIDSRTILDSGGADQLIGKGDMLVSTGNELVRIQCAFIDTPEVEKICDFIGSQRAYPEAYMLPECPDENGEACANNEMNADERDPLFEDAARLVVSTQQGSTSGLQRKFKLGYNRAGRIIDQLESAGIVGSFDGKKTREVKYKDMNALEDYLNSIS